MPVQTLVEVASPEEIASLKSLDAEALSNTNAMKLYVFGNESAEQVRLVALLDNLGKGAGGAAVKPQHHAGPAGNNRADLMYRPRAFVMDDRAVLLAVMREHPSRRLRR